MNLSLRQASQAGRLRTHTAQQAAPRQPATALRAAELHAAFVERPELRDAKPLAERLSCRAATLEEAGQSVKEGATPSARTSSHKEQFNWTKHWYPVGVLDALHEDRPNGMSLLNEELVLWRDEDGEWRAAVDECPHKLAPLSEGRLDNGVLECRYHAWQFNGDGACAFNPQSGDRRGERALKGPRTCLKTFPTKVVQGMLWVWPEAGEAAKEEAARSEPLTYPEVDESAEGWMGAKRSFSFLESEVNWALMVENSLDPSHAPSLHENFLGPRTAMVPMEMKREMLHPTEGILLTHGGYKSSQVDGGMTAERRFTPPHTVRTAYTMGNGFKVNAILYFVPTTPGHCRVFAKFVNKLPAAMVGRPTLLKRIPKPQQLARLLPMAAAAARRAALGLFVSKAALEHVGGHGLQDQDQLMMHHSERRMARSADAEKRPLDWRRYELVSKADAGVAALWKWIEDYSGGDVPWAGGATSADMAPKLHRPFVFDHYSRHTRHCKICQEGVDSIGRTQRVSTGAAAALAAAAILIANPLLRVVAVAAAGCLLWWRHALQNLREQFFFARKLPDE